MNYQKVYMNQIYSSNMMGYLSQMWRNQLLCDAVIKTGNIITKAHRIVLIAACPMLQNMENASLGSHLEVRMAADIKQDSVNAFLQYIYEGYMMLTEENCKDIEKMAKLLQVESVVKCCADFFKCLSEKTGVMHGGPNFNYQDSAEFKHFRITQIQKLAQDGGLKRSMENGRPTSPGGKRQKLRSSSPAEVVVLGSYNRGDDRSSMSSSYKPGGQDPFERVPRIGSGIQHSDSGVKEDTLEVVHKEPPERDADGWPKESRLPPVHRTQSISVSSQLSKETNVQIVNVPNESDRFRVQQTPQSVQMSQARPTPPRTSTAPEPAQQSFSQIQSTAQKLEAQRIAADVMASLPSIHMQASSSVSQQQSMNAPAQKINIDPLPPPLHGPSTSTMRTSAISQPPTHPTQQTPPRLASKPFAAGSAMQATESHSPLSDKREKESNVAQGTSQVIPISAPQESRIPSQNISLQPATTEQIQNVEKLLAGDDVGMPDRKSEPSTSEASPDLSIIKIEEADTGGLDMYVDLPDDTKAMMQAHEGGTCESEDEGDFGQGEASNEGSNFSGEQMGTWQGQDVSFQGQDASFSGDGSFQGQEGSYQDFDQHFERIPSPVSKGVFKPVPLLSKENASFITFDLSTTDQIRGGIIPHIAQISAISNDGREFNCYVKPVFSITTDAQRKTGISMVSNKMTVNGIKVESCSIQEAIDQFIDWLQSFSNIFLIAHTGKRFHFPVLISTLSSVNKVTEFENVVMGFIDSIALFKKVYPGQPSYKQDDLMELMFGVVRGDDDEIVRNALDEARCLASLITCAKAEPKGLIAVSFPPVAVRNQLAFTREKTKNITTLHPLIASGVMKSATAENIAGSGLRLEHLQKIYSRYGEDGLRSTFINKNSDGKCRVTGMDRTIDKVIPRLAEYLNKL